MSDDWNGPEQTFRDTERNLRNLIEAQAAEIERLAGALRSLLDEVAKSPSAESILDSAAAGHAFAAIAETEGRRA